jgi:hypothetical protein
MINDSSTNATDKLVWRLGSTNGISNVNTFLKESGIVDVGEVTSICELDRRIHERRGACARTSMSCFELERWLRDGQTPSPAGQSCVATLSSDVGGAHAGYYATMANSITPLQYARLWRRLLDAEIIVPTSATQLVAVVDGTTVQDTYMGGFGAFYDIQGTKFGSKRSVSSVVGFGYDIEAGQDLADAEMSYSFSLFTEGFDASSGSGPAETLMRRITTDVFTIMAALRDDG